MMGTASVTCKPDICLVYLFMEGRGDTVEGAVENCDSLTVRVEKAVLDSCNSIISILNG